MEANCKRVLLELICVPVKNAGMYNDTISKFKVVLVESSMILLFATSKRPKWWMRHDSVGSIKGIN